MASPPRQGALDYNRMMTRVEKAIGGLTDRVEQIADAQNERIDGVIDRMERIERGMAGGEQDRQRILTEMGEFRTDAGELRDIANRLRTEVSTTGEAQVLSAAKGAAEGAATGTAQLKATAHAGFFATWKGWAVSGLVGVAALSGGVEGVPKIVRFFGELFKFLGGQAK
jgi:hypothetical protein